MIKIYGDLSLADIVAEKPENWDITDATHVRVQLPSSASYVIEMQEAGFFFVDRTIKTSISLSKCPINLEKMVRLPIVETSAYKADILRIACASFVSDRRFHITSDCNANIAANVLRVWVNELEDVLVCLFKDIPVGFLALKETEADSLFVHLAAVEEKYRMTGAAMALYAQACIIARERGYKKLEGRISSQNIAVMNLYTAFGAMFSLPQDIFLKEVRHEA